MPLARSVGQAILKSLVPFNLPGWQMVQIVRQAGYGYHYQTMLGDIREYTGRFKYEPQVTGLGSNQVITESWMNRVEMSGPYRYKVWADVSYYDPASGDYITDVRSMYTDDLKKVGDYQRDFGDVLESAGCRCDMEFMSVKVRGMDLNTRLLQ